MSRAKNSEVYGLSEDAIGLATITTNKQGAITVYIDKDVVKHLDCERITFGRHAMSIKEATLDQTGHKLSTRNTGGGCSFTIGKFANVEDYLGMYEVIGTDKGVKLVRKESE